MTLTLNVEFFIEVLIICMATLVRCQVRLLTTCSMLTAVPSTVASAGI